MAFTCEFSTAFSTAFAICDGGTPALDVPPQTPGGKAPLLRPAYDHLADVRVGETGDVLRQVRALVNGIEEAARQERKAVPVG